LVQPDAPGRLDVNQSVGQETPKLPIDGSLKLLGLGLPKLTNWLPILMM